MNLKIISKIKKKNNFKQPKMAPIVKIFKKKRRL